jgi:hypothetical protein
MDTNDTQAVSWATEGGREILIVDYAGACNSEADGLEALEQYREAVQSRPDHSVRSVADFSGCSFFRHTWLQRCMEYGKPDGIIGRKMRACAVIGISPAHAAVLTFYNHTLGLNGSSAVIKPFRNMEQAVSYLLSQ